MKRVTEFGSAATSVALPGFIGGKGHAIAAEDLHLLHHSQQLVVQEVLSRLERPEPQLLLLGNLIELCDETPQVVQVLRQIRGLLALQLIAALELLDAQHAHWSALTRSWVISLRLQMSRRSQIKMQSPSFNNTDRDSHLLPALLTQL
jgi:hypothetical protein